MHALIIMICLLQSQEKEMASEEEAFTGKWYEYPIMRNAIISGLITVSAFGLAHAGKIPYSAEIAGFLIAIMIGGYHWSFEGLEELVSEKKIGIEILMMAATIGSALLGIWDEAAFLVFLYSGAEGLEHYAYARTRGSIRELLKLAPKTARIIVNEKDVIISAEDLMVGDIFVVRPGESIPTDGVVIRGKSSIDESPVTGESIPVEKKEGERVFAGSLNIEGSLEVQAAASFKDNTLSKIIQLVERAHEEKGRSQLFIEWFGDRYTPLVLLSALILTLLPLVIGGSLSEWAERAVVLLVAAAPCALVMSTPIAIAAGIGKSGREGVLIKGGIHLENLGNIRAVAFDKTGTLTTGKPVVTDILAIDGDEKEVIELAYSVERLSEHPLAQAIIEKAEEMKVRASNVENFACLIGAGVSASIGGKTFYAGKPEFFQEIGIYVPNIAEIEKLRAAGKTAILVGSSDGIKGIIGIRDKVRPGAREVVSGLHSMGIKVIMLTGDSDVVAGAISKELGLDEFRANLKPAGKTEAVKELELRYGSVAMVGDGINDAPALAQATVGIAMGVAGTDVAIEAADVALMADDLAKVQLAIRMGRRSKEISRQNIIFALVVLALLIPSALIGILSVALAVTFHESSELLAILNGLRVAR